jgi:putative PIN family toxin of toxin-antitoxin system
MTSEPKSPRVVIDANIFVSGVLVRQGNPNRLLRAWQRGQVTLVTAPPLIAEVDRTLHKERIRRKYPLSEEEIQELTESLAAAEQAVPQADLPVTARDPKDNQFLAIALGGNAEYLITGDDDLLVLDGHPALGMLRIVTVRTFVELLAERGGQQP